LTREETLRILSLAIEDDHDYMFLRLLIKTGRSFGEVRAITPKDVDFKIYRRILASPGYGWFNPRDLYPKA
jgi:integrase